MNDFKHEIRNTLRRHESDAPTFDASDARRAAGRTRHRQIVNVAGAGIGTLVVVVGLVAGLSGLVRADRPPTVLDTPSPSQTSVPTPTPHEAEDVHGWPGARRNAAGVYSWGKVYSYVTRDPSQNGSHDKRTVSSTDRWIHNGNPPGSGAVNIFVEGDPGRLLTHRGETSVTVAGHEGSYRQFIVADGWRGLSSGPSEEWMVDIQGTTVTITLAAEPGALEAEVAEAHEIIGSIYVDPQDNELGFQLIFTLPTNTWDSG